MPDSDRNSGILAELDALRADDMPTRGGHTFAYVYEAGIPGLDALAADAYARCATVNGLDMTVFPSVLRLENDVVGFAARLLGGGPDTRGSFTSGGTESILLAVKSARDYAREVRGIADPELVLPVTAHVAFRKAARYLGLGVVTVPVDPRTLVPDPDAVAAALTDRTAMVVASAPSYAHGVVDPVPRIAARARERGVWCHVDACVGGMVLPYLRRIGRAAEPFDLSVPGVSSLSVDLHKYGYTDKGASVVLYRDAELRRRQYFASADWPGYPVVNPTMQGSRSAGLLAAAWAVLRRVGDDGYAELAAAALRATDDVVAGIGAIDGVRVLGSPGATLVCIAVDAADPLHVADEMRARGWFLQAQLGYDGIPRNLHLTITPATGPQAAAMLADLAASVRAAALLPSPEPDPGLVEAVAALAPETLTGADIARVMASAGLGAGGAAPKRMAPVLALLDAAPAALKERFLTEFIGSLYNASGVPA
ncbi:glutamate/tyrosine decarboxylase-like PLP-dependent enzyme [Murinocardiopsis flavida]|uniref:Glutamate/tyrosine decarboxylase-like PLP-dependent enzyme n=1 Tax=Murinocardiopsis flavida TaxID=645275 RepID=A0A2P8DE06_9ACTN|nr:aspartate aminotransferase family protein [Murinocardiopsis flavida]PSK95435.1 glutamate/tyrosine decarboxylase-like PLP-dependent enzyme [Murinocardiopsis flavida]